MSSTSGPSSCRVSSRSATRETAERSTWSCGAVWSARHPVKVEAAGSNPVRTASVRRPAPFGAGLRRVRRRPPGARAPRGVVPSVCEAGRAGQADPEADPRQSVRSRPGPPTGPTPSRALREPPRRRPGPPVRLARAGRRDRRRPRRPRPHMPPARPNSAPAAEPTTRGRCERCHRISFSEVGTYPLLTPRQFYMCNCTLPQGAPGLLAEAVAASLNCDYARGWRSAEGPAKGPWRGLQPSSRGQKKIALNPAEFSAIDDASTCKGVSGGPGAQDEVLLGQDRRRVERGDGRLRQLGDRLTRPTIQLWAPRWSRALETMAVRPRCAAGGYPPAGRGPRPRGSAGVRRACGST